MSKHARRLKVLVFGAGAIGSAFGGFLSPHHDVTLLGRERFIDAIRTNGLRVSGIWGRHVFRHLTLATDWRAVARAKTSFDLILVTVKSYDTLEAARAIRQIAGPRTCVLSLQNGLGNIEVLQNFFPSRQILAGRVIFGVVLEAPVKKSAGGKIRVTVMAEPTAIGETCTKKITPRVRMLARFFSEAAIPSVACRDVRSLLWKKVIYNSALNPLASLINIHYGFLGENELTRAVMEEVVHEIYDVAHKARVRLTPATPRGYLKLFYRKLLARTYHHHPSMLQDLRKGKRTEIDALNGAIVRLGEKYCVPTPVNRFLTELVKEEELLCQIRRL